MVGDDLDAESMVVGIFVAQLAGDDRAVDDELSSRVDVVDGWWVNEQEVIKRGGDCGDRAAYRGLGGMRKNRAMTRWGMFFFRIQEGDLDAGD